MNNENQYRILIPSEYEALLDTIPKERLRINIEGLMNTGMRYSEYERFAGDLSMFDAKNRAISLPALCSKTKKARIIHLTPEFSKRLSQYLREHKSLEVPSRRSMDENLKRWYFNSDYSKMQEMPPYPGCFYPTVKTFRKTWESWLLFCRADDGKPMYSYMDIARSQGHSVAISERHYANLDPRLKSEMEAVKKYTKGWMT